MKKILLSTAMLASLCANAQLPTILDSTFGTNGHAMNRPSVNSYSLRNTSLGLNDTILCTGYIDGNNDEDIYITKFNSSGAITTFGNKGTLSLDPLLGANERGEYSVQLPDGKLLVCGSMTGNQNLMDVYIMRLNPDGTIDNSFSNNGMTKFDILGSDYVSNMVIFNNKIYIGAYNYNNGKYIDCHIIRFNMDGTLDQTYGKMGFATLDPKKGDQDNLYSFEMIKDGSVIAIGRTRTQAFVENMFMVKLKPEGTIDSAFGINGYYLHAEAGSTRLRSIAIDDNNNIYWAGYHKVNNLEVGLLVKVDNTGKISTTFGSGNGKIPLSINSQEDLNINDIQLLDSGRILAVGNIGYSAFTAVFEKDGSKHTAYNVTGYKIHPAHDTFMALGYDKILVQSDGKIVMSGYIADSTYSQYQYLTRYKKEETSVSVIDVTVSEMTVYPNPTTGKVYIKAQNTQATSAEIYNISGQMIGKWQQTNSIILPETAANGLYYIKLNTEDRPIVKTVLLKR